MPKLNLLRLSILLAGGFALAPSIPAQVTLSVNKSGNDVVLSWTGGSGTYDVIRSSAFRMSVNTDTLQAGTTGTGFTDAGALAVPTPSLFCYVASDVAAKPTLNITMPCDTPPGGPLCTALPTTANSASVSGTTNSLNPVYGNDILGTTGAGTFSVSGIPLFLGINVITAATRNANGDWSVDSIQIERQNGNQAPTITITTPANGTTIYDRTPFIQINYSDPEGAINTADLAVFLDGTDRTGQFSPVTATQATWQVGSGDALEPGTHFIYASIRDTAPSGASATSEFTLSNPVINSFSPAAEGTIGASITLNGAGFDPTPANNTVTFNGVAAMVTAATATTLTATIPDGAQTGPVVATVDGRSSKEQIFRVLLAAGFISISSVAVNPSVSNHVFFTDRSTNDKLYEILPSGAVIDRCSLNEATGLPLDSSGNLYYGLALAGGVTGETDRYVPGTTMCQVYAASTRLIGETNASVFGAALSEAGGLNVYTADNENGKIKRIAPATNVTAITPAGQIFANPCGMAANAGGSTLYFTSGNNIRSIPIPGGGTPTLVKSLAGGPRGMAITASGAAGGADKLAIARAGATVNAVSWLDPSSTSNPFWDLAGGLSSPQAVALGNDGAPFIVVAEPTRVFRIPRPVVLLTDAADQPLPAKIVADFPSSSATCLEDNMVTLKVKFSPATLIPDTTPRQLVTWTVLDPDDPSNDLVVDTNDTGGPTGGDNIRQIGSYAQWVQVSGFPLTGSATAASVQTEIVGGVSQVTFHLSCQPGDNYQFRAAVTVPIYGAIDSTSEVVTVWRRLHIESDSMGPGVGPFEPDDAAIDEVPETVLAFLENAFRPAYVEVALPPDTGANTPDLAFRNNVDPNLASVIAAQGRLGRGTTSREGYWVLYAQGDYEGPINGDNDPDNEPGFVYFGLTNTLKGRHTLTFVETMRDTSLEPPGLDTMYVNATIAIHEFGHQFGLDHPSGCVMSLPLPPLRPFFCSDAIRAIREIDAPSLLE